MWFTLSLVITESSLIGGHYQGKIEIPFPGQQVKQYFIFQVWFHCASLFLSSIYSKTKYIFICNINVP